MFLVIGERINTSRKPVREAVEKRDADYIQQDVQKQQEAGADFIDVNAGARVGHETEDMKWLLEVIQKVVTVPLCLDSPDPMVLEMAYERVEQPPMVNSISLEKERFDAMAPFLRGKDCKVVALCMDDAGMPKSAGEIIERAGELIKQLGGLGISPNNVYVDPLVQPVGTDTQNGIMVMEAVKGIMTQHEGVHTTCGLSNVSFGMPKRKVINRIFLCLMMSYGLDSAILDPLDRQLMSVVKTTEMLMGKDDFCMQYLKATRAGVIGD
jgi:5-methyltetrahydrofolate--homocysteine methyltransferase